jgi:hypothetical protein
VYLVDTNRVRMQIEVGFLWNVMTTARPQSGLVASHPGFGLFQLSGGGTPFVRDAAGPRRPYALTRKTLGASVFYLFMAERLYSASH